MIFYGENDFVCQNYGFDPATCFLVKQKVRAENFTFSAMRKLASGLANTKVLPNFPRNWTNMVAWLRAFNDGTCLGFGERFNEHDSVELDLILTLFRTAGHQREVSKEALSVLIDSIRPAFVQIHADWAEDW